MSDTRPHRLRHTLALAMGAALAVAPAASAQEHPDRDNCVCFGGGDYARFLDGSLANGRRARIGILMGGEAGVDGRVGVRVEAVSQDGPAEEAGLHEGDIITALNGESLGDDPTRGLLDLMRHVEPGDAVTLTYYRNGDRRTAEVVTDEMDRVSIFGGRDGDGPFDIRGAPRFDVHERSGAAGRFHVVSPSGLMARLTGSGLRLVELNPGLGEYFGTDEGVLVADIDDDSPLGLQPGDVILSIDGREVHDPGHAHRILASYRADEEVTIRIVRRDRRMDVTGTVR